jgi:hypothetical protein
LDEATGTEGTESEEGIRSDKGVAGLWGLEMVAAEENGAGRWGGAEAGDDGFGGTAAGDFFEDGSEAGHG